MVLIETLEAVFLTEPPTVSRGFANEMVWLLRTAPVLRDPLCCQFSCFPKYRKRAEGNRINQKSRTANVNHQNCTPELKEIAADL